MICLRPSADLHVNLHILTHTHTNSLEADVCMSVSFGPMALVGILKVIYVNPKTFNHFLGLQKVILNVPNASLNLEK